MVPSNGNLGRNWLAPGFDDSGWTRGVTGLGYETGSGYEDPGAMLAAARRNFREGFWTRWDAVVDAIRLSCRG